MCPGKEVVSAKSAIKSASANNFINLAKFVEIFYTSQMCRFIKMNNLLFINYIIILARHMLILGQGEWPQLVVYKLHSKGE